MGIDQEEDFRHSIQNFYEQSLTKILLERKYDSFESNPSRQEIDRFLELESAHPGAYRTFRLVCPDVNDELRVVCRALDRATRFR